MAYPSASNPNKSRESSTRDDGCAACRSRDAPQDKVHILSFIFTKLLCDAFDDELSRIATDVESREKASALLMADNNPFSAISASRGMISRCLTGSPSTSSPTNWRWCHHPQSASPDDVKSKQSRLLDVGLDLKASLATSKPINAP